MLEIAHKELIPDSENIYAYVFCYPNISEVNVIYTDKDREEFGKLFPMEEYLVGRFQIKSANEK